VETSALARHHGAAGVVIPLLDGPTATMNDDGRLRGLAVAGLRLASPRFLLVA
jgi:hypothetical protein